MPESNKHINLGMKKWNVMLNFKIGRKKVNSQNTLGCGIVVNEVVENHVASSSILIGDKKILGDSSYLS